MTDLLMEREYISDKTYVVIMDWIKAERLVRRLEHSIILSLNTYRIEELIKRKDEDES